MDNVVFGFEKFHKLPSVSERIQYAEQRIDMCLKTLPDRVQIEKATDSNKLILHEDSIRLLEEEAKHPNRLSAATVFYIRELYFPTKTIDEVVFGESQSMAIPNIDATYLYLYSQLSTANQVQIRSLITETLFDRASPGERLRVISKDRTTDPICLFGKFKTINMVNALCNRILDRESTVNIRELMQCAIYGELNLEYLLSQDYSMMPMHKHVSFITMPMYRHDHLLLCGFTGLSIERKTDIIRQEARLLHDQ